MDVPAKNWIRKQAAKQPTRKKMHKHFHVPQNYFLSHSVGCLPKTTQANVERQFFEDWETLGGNAWPAWLGVLGEFRNSLAAFIGAKQADICPQTNVSSALTKLLYSLPKNPARKTILMSPQDFPTIGFALKQAERTGFILKFIEGDVTDINSWADAMDESVFMVHITHALSNTSQILPIADICALARKCGAYSVVDIAQSIGAVPINVAVWQADFAIGTSVKFLCGGPGACFLYVSPDIIEQCRPIDVGWFSHENPFEMDIHSFRYAPDALRFWGGTPSPMPYASALNALKLWGDLGAPYKAVQSILTHLTKYVPDTALISPREANMRGGTLVVQPKNRHKFKQVLGKHKILHDERNEGFRFSVHGYTAKSDIENLVHCLQTQL